MNAAPTPKRVLTRLGGTCRRVSMGITGMDLTGAKSDLEGLEGEERMTDP